MTACAETAPKPDERRFHQIAAILAIGITRLGHSAKTLETSQKLAPETSSEPVALCSKPSVSVCVG